MSDKRPPPESEHEAADTETAGPRRIEVVTACDHLGRVSETVAAADAEAASHWRADLWRSTDDRRAR